MFSNKNKSQPSKTVNTTAAPSKQTASILKKPTENNVASDSKKNDSTIKPVEPVDHNAQEVCIISIIFVLSKINSIL